MTFNQSFGQYLHSTVKAVGIPPAEIARQCGVSRQMLYCYFRDTNRPSPQTLDKMCAILGLSPVHTAGMFVRKRMGRPLKF